MLSSTAEYALRAVVHLAGRPPRPHTAAETAAATQIPSGYVSKVLQALARARLVTSRRGPNGGFELTRPPRDISALDVINAVDPMKRITVCPLGIASHGTKLCRLHRRLDDTIAQIEAALRETSIEELVEDDGAAALCQRDDAKRAPAAGARLTVAGGRARRKPRAH